MFPDSEIAKKGWGEAHEMWSSWHPSQQGIAQVLQAVTTEVFCNRQKLLSELKECQKKEKRLQSEASALLDKADNLCAEAEKSHKWNLIIEANALRAKGKQKRKEADEAKNEAEVMTKKLKFE